MANDIIYFLKRNQGPIIKYAKKLFRWLKQKQSQGGAGQQQQQQQYHQGGYAGAAAGGQQQQQQPYYAQQQQPPQQPYGSSGDDPAPWLNKPGIKPNHPNYDDNRVNSANARYQELRSSARKEGDAMARCFDESHKAYSSGDGGRAKQLSNEGNQHKARMEQLNREAADWIFKANNEDSASDELDLHGLYTKEAIEKTEAVIRQAQAQGKPQLRIIVGKGIHSKDHVAHIKPAIEKLMRDYNLAANIDPRNAGVLIVHLQNGGAGTGGYRDAGFTRDLAKQASGNEEQCSIM